MLIRFTLAFFSALIIFFSNVNAQDSLALKYAKTIDANELRSIIFQLAGDEMEGRASGEEGQKKAAKYISDYYFNCGINPLNETDYYQTFFLKRIRYQSSPLAIQSNSLIEGVDYAVYNPRTSRKIESSTFLWGVYLNQLDIEKSEVENQILIGYDSLLNALGAEGNTRMAMANIRKIEEQLRDKDPKALFVITKNVERFYKRLKLYYDSNPLFYELNNNEIPIVLISEETANKIISPSKVKLVKWKKCFDAGKKTKVIQNFENILLEINSNIEEVSTENVLAYIPGSDLKEELIVITGHYDHLGKKDGKIYYGADDNGSGTAGIMTLAKAFNNARVNGHGTRRSILIINFTAEEIGLLGSRYYTSNPVFSLSNTVANLNIDMIGRSDDQHKDNSNYVYVIGADKLSSQLDSLNTSVNQTYSKMELDYTFNQPNDPNRFYYRSDHYNFAKNNIPCIFYFSGVHEDYHKPGDTPDKIDINKVEKITKLVFYTAWEIANMPTRLIVDKAADENRD